jgi:hypothetical protein
MPPFASLASLAFESAYSYRPRQQLATGYTSGPPPTGGGQGNNIRKKVAVATGKSKGGTAQEDKVIIPFAFCRAFCLCVA